MNAAPQLQVTFDSNPVAGKLVLVPRSDAADPSFWRKKGGGKREPHPAFSRFAKHMVGYRDDATGALTMAFARSMESRLAKVYAVEFAEYLAREYFAMSTEIDAGARSWSYKMIERVGQAALINDGNARDLPRISIGGQETQMPVVTYGAAYGFNIIDEASASLADIALETELAKGTREAIEAFAELMYAIGIPGTDIVGVTNAPGIAVIPQVSLASGTWAVQIASIAAATPTSPSPDVAVANAIATDLLFGKQTIAQQTLGRQKAKRALLPTNLFDMLEVPQGSAFKNSTLLDYVKLVTGLDIQPWNILQNIGTKNGSTPTISTTSGAAQKTRIMVYDDSEDVIQLMEAQPFVQLAPQLAGLEYTVPCYERSGGVKAVRPLGAVCIDGC